jgi:hypothetical protein
MLPIIVTVVADPAIVHLAATAMRSRVLTVLAQF